MVHESSSGDIVVVVAVVSCKCKSAKILKSCFIIRNEKGEPEIFLKQGQDLSLSQIEKSWFFIRCHQMKNRVVIF